jgi:hypothetical protein
MSAGNILLLTKFNSLCWLERRPILRLIHHLWVIHYVVAAVLRKVATVNVADQGSLLFLHVINQFQSIIVDLWLVLTEIYYDDLHLLNHSLVLILNALAEPFQVLLFRSISHLNLILLLVPLLEGTLSFFVLVLAVQLHHVVELLVLHLQLTHNVLWLITVVVFALGPSLQINE